MKIATFYEGHGQRKYEILYIWLDIYLLKGEKAFAMNA